MERKLEVNVSTRETSYTGTEIMALNYIYHRNCEKHQIIVPILLALCSEWDGDRGYSKNTFSLFSAPSWVIKRLVLNGL